MGCKGIKTISKTGKRLSFLYIIHIVEIMENLIGDYAHHALKLLVALGLGMLMGFERQKSGKTAGIKTHGLVSMGSAMYVIISIIISEMFIKATIFDPLRVASHIIVGVGFIGGGAIFIKEKAINGLTTAANLWVAAGIGMAVGFGIYPLAILVALMSLLVFLISGIIERRKARKDHENLS